VKAPGRPAGFLLHVDGATPTRHLTLLGAMKAAAVLAQTGDVRDVRVEDLGRGIAWKLTRPPRSSSPPRPAP